MKSLNTSHNAAQKHLTLFQSNIKPKLTAVIKMISLSIMVIFVVFISNYIEAKSVYADQVVRRGSFVGAGGHTASGEVEIIQRDDGSYYVHLAKSFSLDRAPDPFLGFGDRSFDKSTRFSRLRKTKGQQNYDIPSKIDPLSYDKFYLWCKAYSVTLAVATLRP